jgi:hypothetical protein
VNKISTEVFLPSETGQLTPDPTNDSQSEIQQNPALTGAEIGKLRQLLEFTRYDAASGTLTIQTGKARVLLRQDGTVRVEGRRIVQMSETSIVLDGATIELN